MKLKIEKNIPIPNRINKELSNALISLNEGDSVYLKFSEFTRSSMDSCIANARQRIMGKGLCLTMMSDKEGRRVWAVKKDYLKPTE